MIKTAIIGASSEAAGELVRILVNHPEVDLECVAQPDLAGRSIASLHKGLIGESSLTVSSSLDPVDFDVVFIAEENQDALFLREHLDLYPDLRVVDLTGICAGTDGFVYGVPEIFRKPLVRGARFSYIPNAVESAVLVSLFPLAKNLLLNTPLQLTLEGDPAAVALGGEASATRIADTLQEVQQSFCSQVSLVPQVADSMRGLRVSASIPMGIGIDKVIELYEEVYDDHNFTFMVGRRLHMDEVMGTNKCLISLFKPDNATLTVEAIVDPSLRGSAGEAVHVMNLLFGLHEKIGLTFKINTHSL